jgi:NADPH:quinone reductase-like Zn-dependent oxidoreductase
LAGTVATVGKTVTRFKVGDEVFAFPGASYGCHAEYRVMAEDGLIALKPPNLSLEEAAALSFGGANALQFLRDKAGIRRGNKVLIVGASGGVGTAAVQLARHFGAEVTGVCSTTNVEVVHSLGASKVIDYTQQDFAKLGETYDIIFDTTGTVPFARAEHALKPGGRLVAVQGTLAQALGIGRPSKRSGKTVIAGVVTPRVEDLQFLAELAATGVFKPVIDRRYPLELMEAQGRFCEPTASQQCYRTSPLVA